MSEWVRICSVAEAPAEGKAMELEANGVDVCLTRISGEFRAMDNWCPHRRGPLGAGWVDGNSVVCPLHCWKFDTLTGIAEPPERAHVDVFPLKVESGEIWVDIS